MVWHGKPAEQLADNKYRSNVYYNEFAGQTNLDKQIEDNISILKRDHGYSDCNFYQEHPQVYRISGDKNYIIECN